MGARPGRGRDDLKTILGAAIAAIALLVIACAGPRPKPAKPEARPGRAVVQEGLASFYGKAHHGKTTANGERFDMNGLTAAHRTAPFGTRLRVTDLSTGKSVVVRVNDRGPYAGGRIVDLSYGAAKVLGMVDRGVARVRVEPVAGRAARTRRSPGGGRGRRPPGAGEAGSGRDRQPPRAVRAASRKAPIAAR